MFKLLWKLIVLAIIGAVAFVIISLSGGGDKFRWFGKKVEQESEKIGEKADTIKEKSNGVKRTYEKTKRTIDQLRGREDDEKSH